MTEIHIEMTPDMSAPLTDVERLRMFQFGLGLTAGTMARLDRLRACIGNPRNRVVEEALLNGGLGQLEQVYAARVRRFGQLAQRAGMSWERYAEAYSETYSTRTYPPTVEHLEELERRQVIDDARSQ